MKINWVSKLTSRKFWLAVVGFVGPTLIAFGATDEIATQVSAIIMSGATLIAYICGEGFIDANRVTTSKSRQADGESDGD